ncbi:MAG: hemerythrin domain-containing protein [bacterium]|nr:hemerythrin domain-containing protein [bacterium]
MKATKQLKEEHQAVLLLLSILRKIREKIGRKEEIPSQHLEEILEFFKVFVDKCHHKKEEGILFPMITGAEIPEEKGLIGDLLRDHAILHEYVKVIDESFTGFKAGDQRNVERLMEAAKSYITLLTEHISKEDDILFELADQYLLREADERMMEQFEYIEINQLGSGKHKQFERMLERLEKIYLKKI